MSFFASSAAVAKADAFPSPSVSSRFRFPRRFFLDFFSLDRRLFFSPFRSFFDLDLTSPDEQPELLGSSAVPELADPDFSRERLPQDKLTCVSSAADAEGVRMSTRRRSVS